uniref:Uncharacterized protein n=1 Tax=Panagrolaimus sp. ES5 TaxID=591445 RepID=A0AC34FQ22_9BILA
MQQQRQKDNNAASKEKIIQAIKQLNDANPQHKIAKQRLQARLESLEAQKQQIRRKSPKENEKDSRNSQSGNDFRSDSEPQSLNDRDKKQPQIFQSYDRKSMNLWTIDDSKSMNLWTIDDSLKKGHRIIDRRQKLIKKQEMVLKRDLASSKKAEEAIKLLKQQIEYKYDMVSDGLMKLKQKQRGDIMAMKDQIKCISRQNEENAESERNARGIVSAIAQNQITPISSLIGDFAVGIVRLFLYSIAALRDLIFHRGEEKKTLINVEK